MNQTTLTPAGPSGPPAPRHAFTVTFHGSLCLVTPNTPAASMWLDATAPDDAQFLGRGMAVEPRYIDDFVAAADADGFTCGGAL